MTSLAVALPEQLQVLVEDPEASITVFQQDFPRRAIASEIDKQERIADVQLVRAVLEIGRELRQPGFAQQPPGAAVEDLELEIASEHDFDAAVPVEVVDLKRRVVRQQCVLRVRPPLLPEHTPFERHRGEATDLIESVAAHLGNVLREQHVEPAVAVEIAEADVSAGAEAWRVELFPEHRLRVVGAQAVEIGRATLDAATKIGGRCRTCRDAETT